MSYFNTSLLANGLNNINNLYGSWVLIGENKANTTADDSETPINFNKGEQTDEDTMEGRTLSTISNNIDISSPDISSFKDINIAAMTVPKKISENAQYIWGADSSGNSGTTGLVTNNVLFKDTLSLKIKGETTLASSTKKETCFVFMSSTEHNINECGFTLNSIWYVVWNNISSDGSFPTRFSELKDRYNIKDDSADTYSYWTSNANYNQNSNYLIGDANMILFGTDAKGSDTTLFNDYNYTSFTVGDLTITLQGLATSSN